MQCDSCDQKDMDNLMNPFAVIKNCSSDYNCTRALLIKNHQPKLNK